MKHDLNKNCLYLLRAYFTHINTLIFCRAILWVGKVRVELLIFLDDDDISMHTINMQRLWLDQGSTNEVAVELLKRRSNKNRPNPWTKRSSCLHHYFPWHCKMLLNLPHEVFLLVCERLSHQGVIAVGGCSRRLHRASQDEIVCTTKLHLNLERKWEFPIIIFGPKSTLAAFFFNSS